MTLFDDYEPIPDAENSDVVLTPKWLFDELQLEFDLDPAHPPYDTFVPTKKYYTEKDDGLEKDWDGLVWLNPPYSKITPWVDKWLNHQNGMLLVPWAKSAWLGKLFNSDAHVFMLNQDKVFEKHGKEYSIWMPVGLWAIGYEATKALGKLQGRIR